jgi:predicted TIM-barrel fold metal-dependent hydrolase
MSQSTPAVQDREQWLARTVETAIEPDVPVCDPHHHVWIFPDSHYLVDELLADLAGHRVESTVFVECHQMYRTGGPAPLRPVGETEFVARLAGPHRCGTGVTQVAAGIVGFADLTLGARVREVIEAHLAASTRLRGVRYATAWDASPQIRNSHTGAPPGLLADGAFREGLACLGEYGLVFDAWAYHPQLPEIVDLARAFPAMTIVVNHAGGPLGIGPYADRREEVFAVWRQNIVELSRCPNVVMKLGGLTMTMTGFGWHKRDAPPGSLELAAAMGPYVHTCIEHFGAGRCMFESNFPVDRASCSYTVLWNAYKRLGRGYGAAERGALFRDTARRVYRLEY